MEVTIIELWLFVWAIGATAYAVKRDGDAKSHVHMLQLILGDKEARGHILAQFDNFKESLDANEN
jgi:hypothetical protein